MTFIVISFIFSTIDLGVLLFGYLASFHFFDFFYLSTELGIFYLTNEVFP